MANQDSQRLPLIDLSEEIQHHVVIAQGTDEVYQGHPTTVRGRPVDRAAAAYPP